MPIGATCPNKTPFKHLISTGPSPTSILLQIRTITTNQTACRIIILGIILNNIPLWRLSVGGRLARPFPNYTSSKTKPRRIQFPGLIRSCFDSPFPKKARGLSTLPHLFSPFRQALFKELFGFDLHRFPLASSSALTRWTRQRCAAEL